MKIFFIVAILFGFFLSDKKQNYLMTACPEFKESNIPNPTSIGQFSNR